MGEVMTRAIAAGLWLFLIASALAVIVMVWHPWVQPWTGVPRADR
jgi:hypothetical protein